jgi:hypothetical protein
MELRTPKRQQETSACREGSRLGWLLRAGSGAEVGSPERIGAKGLDAAKLTPPPNPRWNWLWGVSGATSLAAGLSWL